MEKYKLKSGENIFVVRVEHNVSLRVFAVALTDTFYNNGEDFPERLTKKEAEKIIEKLEDFDSKRFTKAGFKLGAKWQQKRSYSEEEIYNLIQAGYSFCEKGKNREDVKKWFEQFKKK